MITILLGMYLGNLLCQQLVSCYVKNIKNNF